ncbi:SAM-dependent methyltransferase [Spinactinospora alkalitolerans]|uniref:SAM-dependent methyltransferase n=1 Tax=Spinactinospora alkalitolerans TaxID=687207 RepID=A0A852U450_9ACTN|nr:N-6 DNA methylase [Spinactinospora alkalitolerans]NYE50377.1 SAM-dependent methyltransferase [Spinactinospora alkalitolerans]
MNSVEIARLAGVGRAAVSNWRRRHADFPQPVGGTDGSPLFDLGQVRAWLMKSGKLNEDDDPAAAIETAWKALDPLRAGMDGADAVALVGAALLLAEREPSGLEGLAGTEFADRLTEIMAAEETGTPPLPLPDVHTLRAALLDAVRSVNGLGDAAHAFELLHQRYLTSVARNFFADTPEVGALMLGLAGRPDGTVLDPSCGTGSLLRTVAEAVPGAAVMGQEIEPAVARLARVRLLLAGGDPDIRCGDSLRADAFPGLTADAVIGHPPFNQVDWGFEELSLDTRWEYGFPARRESELAWVQHALAHVRPGGAVVMVLPPTVASRSSGRRVRRDLIRRGALRAVISLPAGVTPPMGVPLSVWVLRRPVQGEPVPGEVLLFDAADGQDAAAGPGPEGSPPWPDVAATVIEVHRMFTEDPATVVERPGRHRVMPVSDLLDESVDVTPGRYLQRPGPGITDLTGDRDELLRLAGALSDALPAVRPGGGGNGGHQAMISIGDFVRTGGLEILQARSADDATGSGGGGGRDSVAALTGGDVVHDGPPSGRVPRSGDVVRLRPGDVVLPRVTRRPAARVVTDEKAVLHGTAYALRPDPDVLDPWFLAGFLIGAGASLAATSTSRPGTTRVSDLRKVEVPRLPLTEQRAYGATFKQVTEFRRMVKRTYAVGRGLWTSMAEGLAAGTLRPGAPDSPEQE